jgi:hypothetical protein
MPVRRRSLILGVLAALPAASFAGSAGNAARERCSGFVVAIESGLDALRE